MEGGEESTGRRSIPSLAHALEEARARAKLHHEARLQDIDESSFEDTDEDEEQPKPIIQTSGSLLDLIKPSVSRNHSSESKSERARLAVEANAARRALSMKETRQANEIQESMDDMRTMLGECLIAVRECREMVRAMSTRRDRNYF